MDGTLTTQTGISRTLAYILAGSMALNTVAIAALFYQNPVRRSAWFPTEGDGSAPIGAAPLPSSAASPTPTRAGATPQQAESRPGARNDRRGRETDARGQQDVTPEAARDTRRGIRPAPATRSVSRQPGGPPAQPVGAGEVDLAFHDVKVVGLVNANTKERKASLRLRDGQLRLVPEDQKHPKKVIPLRAIRELTYAPSKHTSIVGHIVRIGAWAASQSLNNHLPGVGDLAMPWVDELTPQVRGLKHFLVIRTATETTVVRLHGDSYREVLAALNKHSDIKVQEVARGQS
jgi:hypothetical protein